MVGIAIVLIFLNDRFRFECPFWESFRFQNDGFEIFKMVFFNDRLIM